MRKTLKKIRRNIRSRRIARSKTVRRSRKTVRRPRRIVRRSRKTVRRPRRIVRRSRKTVRRSRRIVRRSRKTVRRSRKTVRRSKESKNDTRSLWNAKSLWHKVPDKSKYINVSKQHARSLWNKVPDKSNVIRASKQHARSLWDAMPDKSKFITSFKSNARSLSNVMPDKSKYINASKYYANSLWNILPDKSNVMTSFKHSAKSLWPDKQKELKELKEPVQEKTDPHVYSEFRRPYRPLVHEHNENPHPQKKYIKDDYSDLEWLKFLEFPQFPQNYSEHKKFTKRIQDEFYQLLASSNVTREKIIKFLEHDDNMYKIDVNKLEYINGEKVIACVYYLMLSMTHDNNVKNIIHLFQNKNNIEMYTKEYPKYTKEPLDLDQYIDDKNNTMILYYTNKSNIRAVKILLDLGARPDIPNKQDKTAFDNMINNQRYYKLFEDAKIDGVSHNHKFYGLLIKEKNRKEILSYYNKNKKDIDLNKIEKIGDELAIGVVYYLLNNRYINLEEKISLMTTFMNDGLDIYKKETVGDCEVLFIVYHYLNNSVDAIIKLNKITTLMIITGFDINYKINDKTMLSYYIDNYNKDDNMTNISVLLRIDIINPIDELFKLATNSIFFGKFYIGLNSYLNNKRINIDDKYANLFTLHNKIQENINNIPTIDVNDNYENLQRLYNKTNDKKNDKIKLNKYLYLKLMDFPQNIIPNIASVGFSGISEMLYKLKTYDYIMSYELLIKYENNLVLGNEDLNDDINILGYMAINNIMLNNSIKTYEFKKNILDKLISLGANVDYIPNKDNYIINNQTYNTKNLKGKSLLYRMLYDFKSPDNFKCILDKKPNTFVTTDNRFLLEYIADRTDFLNIYIKSGDYKDYPLSVIKEIAMFVINPENPENPENKQILDKLIKKIDK